MSVLKEIAFYQGRRDEVPNQVLAQKLVTSESAEDIREIAEYLTDSNKTVAGNCIKVLYEIGYEKPQLIAPYVKDFLKLLTSKNNRLVWGGMIALSTIAKLEANSIWKNIYDVIKAVETGSVITQDAGMLVIAGVASANVNYKQDLLPVLFDFLEKCRPKDLPSRLQSFISLLESEAEKEMLQQLIQIRKDELSPAQLRKLKAILRKAEFQIPRLIT